MTTKIHETDDSRFSMEIDIPRIREWETNTWRPVTQKEVDELVAIRQCYYQLAGIFRTFNPS